MNLKQYFINIYINQIVSLKGISNLVIPDCNPVIKSIVIKDYLIQHFTGRH